MSWKDEQRERDESVLAELREINTAMADLRPKVTSKAPLEPPSRPLGLIGGLPACLRLCRDSETGETLPAMLKLVPGEYREGHHGLTVRCPCGGVLETSGHLEPCPGECGRWMVGDESGVWSVQLPEQESG